MDCCHGRPELASSFARYYLGPLESKVVQSYLRQRQGDASVGKRYHIHKIAMQFQGSSLQSVQFSFSEPPPTYLHRSQRGLS